MDTIDVIVHAAARDASIARALREICALDGPVRSCALDLMGAHLRAQAVAPDVLHCLELLRRDDFARRIAERLGAPE